MGRPRKPEKEKHVRRALQAAKYRAKRDSVPFTLTFEYLFSIAVDECPVFNTPFEWGASGMGAGKTKRNAPTLDRVVPELGYIEGNVAFISHRANRLKDNGTMEEHYAIADWIWNQTHAKEKSTTPVPAGSYIPGAVGAELGSVSTPWTWEDSDDAHHHCGADAGKDAYHSTKEGSGNSVGHGGQEVGAPEALKNEQSDGHTRTAHQWIERSSRYLLDQLGERIVAAGTASKIRKLGD